MVGSFVGEYDPNLERIHNLYCFNANFSKYVHSEDLWKQSPDYILEKYNYWIGFNPIVPSDMKRHEVDVYGNLIYTPDSMTDFFLKYRRIWKSTDLVKRQLLYLKSTESRMNLNEMVYFFEKYIGSLSMISPEPKKGLHPVLYQFISDVISKNDDTITKVLRDMKLGELI